MAELPPLPPGATLAGNDQALPPLPQGATLASHPDAPPLPAGATLKNNSDKVSQEKPGTLQAIGTTIKNIPGAFAGGLKEIFKATTNRGHQSFEKIKGDLTSPVQSHDKAGKPGSPRFMDYAARAGETALDVLNVPFNLGAGPVEATAGRVSEQMGGPKKETVGDVTMMVAPFAGELKAGATALTAGLKDGAKAVEKLLSPTTVSPAAQATERTIRRATGESSLVNEKAAERLVEHNKTLANASVAEQRALIDDIEHGRTPADPKMAAAAKDIRQVYDGWKNRITQVLPKAAIPSFITDYYAHMWKENPTVVGEKMGAFAKQGSGRSFKQRTIPTISDGIKAGLTPKFENPVETTMAYSQNMSRYVATHDMLNELKTQGYAKWYSPGSKNIPPNWVKLDGIMTSKTAPMSAGTIKAGTPAGSNTGKTLATGRQIQLYAPPEVARVFNNFISKGMEHGDIAPFYQAARTAANGMTQLKLGLSAYHLSTMANEAMINDYARAFRAASRGELKTAGKAMLTAPVAPVKSYMRGMKMQRELLDKQVPDAMSKQINDAFVKSGQTLRMDPFLRTRASGSFYNALHKGTFKRELKEAADRIYKGTAWEKTKGVADLAANVIQTTAAPLFEKYIPAVKRGAFASEMEDFLKSRPKATQDEIDKEAIKIADSIDNRFGELNQDNLFWNKTMKQAAQLALLSPTWNLGTIREIGGGIKDVMGAAPQLAKGEGISRRTAYIAGLAFNTALMSSVYQYLKTGKPPGSVKDLMAPQTGGTDIVSGKPERAMTPGYQKDVYAFGYDFPHHIMSEAENKLNPALQTATGLIQNKDYRGLPIYRPEGVQPIKGEPGVLDYLIEQFMPISVGQFSKGNKKGSNLGVIERGLSVRPAPSYMTDPQRVQQMQTKYGTLDWKKRLKADAREKSRLQ